VEDLVSQSNTMKLLTAFAAGALFTAGLAVSGMTQPEKVLGFLDVSGSWDASLMFVMVGAIGVHFTARRLLGSMKKPVYAHSFHTFASTKIDARLVVGAALFGVGWGLSGYCPGPVIASTVVSGRPVLVFVAAMVLGMAAWEIIQRLRSVDTNAEIVVSSAPRAGRDPS
jgi:uncharacterized membrane protein YedE/YeeE